MVGERRKSSGWRRLAVGLGMLAMILVVLLVVSVAGDQFRQVSAPAFKLPDLHIDAGPLEAPRISAHPGKALELDLSGVATSTTLAEAGNGSAILTPSQFIARLRPAPDLSQVRDGGHELAREWNAAMDRISIQLLRVLYTRDETSLKQAKERLAQINREFRELAKRFREKNPLLISAPDGSWEPASNYQEWHDCWWEVCRAILVQHGKWEEVASYYRTASDWDREVYYLRQGGLRGRGRLVLRSLERVGEKIGALEQTQGFERAKGND